MEYLKSAAAKLGLHLTSSQLEQFRTYYQELVEWNRRANLTSITDFGEVQIKHFLDSVTVTTAFKQPVNAGLSLIDVGSGGGFPGLPVKIIFPNIRLVLLEATGKKAAFLRHITEVLGLENVEIVAGRAEVIAHQAQYRQRFDVVLSRAVAPLATLAELCLPLCAIGGSFIAQKKGDADLELSQAAGAIGILGGGRPEIKMVDLKELADKRYLVVIKKIAPTPAKYPRRPGMPAKRPLV
jgi:16S rRNA (guanine527-N7)-methyltransferase